MKCKKLTKCLNGKFKCRDKKAYIDYRVDCKSCLKFILAPNKSINKVSKKRVFVKNTVYDEDFKRDKGKCQLCGNTNIQLHHIVYRSEDKSLINEPSNCIMLCVKCHKKVHQNKHYWQPKLKEILK